ncbi:class I adenylate-forming enzyme family protein [Limobrevibacterium gyesilva]|uniref:Acyl--CoA ligase n=1 Tax=Limobrevibacterium gyesilva TaxID=2991712 RepID=A0AA41YU84_9PROT|nr:class I adenylate-forming enzyme family protein [Limobrevibacterium gyesilva]MCW3475512.1 acyl--CoA ligase [Limobrevibacterium gyesilva]
MSTAPCLLPYFARVNQIESEPLPRNIDALLDAAADAAPDQVALHFIADDQTYTYRALRDVVNKAASGLAALGVGYGTHVALMMPNIPQWPITWLALARLGAVCVPINVRYTSRELQFAIDDAEVEHLVIAEQHLPVAAELTGGRLRTVVVVGEAGAGQLGWHDVVAGGDARFTPAREPLLDDLMNIQYTSGTTGLPKGCLLTQRYWLTCAKVHADADGMEHQNILASNPYFYMTPQWLTLMAFFRRGTLFVATHRSGTSTMAWIRKYRIHFALVGKIIFDQPPSADDADNNIKKVAIYGFPKQDHAALERRFGFVAREAFGMTEIGSGLFMPPEASCMTGSGSAGLAAPFRECRIADMDGNTLPADQVGELLFRGPGLLTGYYRRPDANAAGFHGDWFRTGDLARQDKDGFIYIVGRIKDMVRRAGESVAAREVEEVLIALPEIEEAAVVPVPDALRGEEVKAYIRLRAGVTPEALPPAAVFEHCSRNLAVFKVPRYLEYRIVDFPRTPSGKIRKSELVAERPDLRVGSWDRVAGRAI